MKQVLNVMYFMYFGQSVNKDCNPGLWLAEIFTTSSLLQRIRTENNGKQTSSAMYEICVLVSFHWQRWPPYPLTVPFYISVTAGRNLTKLTGSTHWFWWNLSEIKVSTPATDVLGWPINKDGSLSIWFADAFPAYSFNHWMYYDHAKCCTA